MLLAATPALAQDAHVVDEAELHEAVVNQADTETQQREAIRTLLQRKEVRDIAENHGLDIVKAKNAVSMLQGPDLARVAAQASQVNMQLAGGADQIVIGTTTLIIILLIIIILILL
ncbi:MAG TPA: hypothetical protein VKP65_23675 [Rhodothermales bacterium]|nr:hypothetical protein [Rhodothermales bacterium]